MKQKQITLILLSMTVSIIALIGLYHQMSKEDRELIKAQSTLIAEFKESKSLSDQIIERQNAKIATLTAQKENIEKNYGIATKSDQEAMQGLRKRNLDLSNLVRCEDCLRKPENKRLFSHMPLDSGVRLSFYNLDSLTFDSLVSTYHRVFKHKK